MNDDIRFGSTEFVEQFLQIYKQHPSLWKMKSNEYISKHHKNAAYDALVSFCKTFNPDADREFVARKIQSLRGCFRREVKKVRQSQRTAASPSQVHKPSLWYYDLMTFLIDQEGQNGCISCTDGIEQYDDNECDSNDMKTEVMDTAYEEDSKQDIKVFPDTWSYGQNSPVDQLPNKRRKEEFESVGCSALSDSFPAPSNYLERSEDSKEFDAVGVNVAAKLKKMTSSQQIYAELLINKVLAKGLLNKLTEETDLSDF